MLQKKLEQISILQMVYLLAVVVYGAFVRSTGSGAGCGDHWPLCNGEMIPHSPGVKTMIEYGHRIMSALVFPLFAYFYFLVKKEEKEHIQKNQKSDPLLTKLSKSLLAFILIEALIGAVIVLIGHVADSKAQLRAISMSIHLLNTFALMANATLITYQVKYRDLELKWQQFGSSSDKGVRFIALFCLLMLGVSGAVTALGDTVFPVVQHGQALMESMDASSHLFVKLRIYHPFMAVILGIFVFFLVHSILKHSQQRFGKLHKSFSHLIFLQFLIGYMNVRWFAPVWLQLIHLLIAELLWMALVVIALTCYGDEVRVAA